MKKRNLEALLVCGAMMVLVGCGEQTVTTSTKETTVAEVTKEAADEIQWYYKELEDGTLSIYDYDAENVPETLKIPSEINGKSVTKLERMFSQEDKIKKVVIPESVRVIGDDTFLLSSSIEFVEIEGMIEAVGENAFFCCEKLNKLCFKEGLKKIDVSGIEGCPLLKEVHLPRSLEEIEGWSFRKCDPDLVIYAPAGSYAEEYAKTVEVAFQAE